uniref:NOT2/NOT3/NOT5 C-terminal domain-containing protein n=1 Tax=Aureoumbra lagunensis TaxID=44058 RepID=A0A7S3JSH1_9STRA|mmetsp:Transcript_2814/g.3890  ORF Transcript_2814/g.3890 Transcript_2814/m.3890 type:complete len:593 (-) Transcript_2814:450-2228(-)|eukprot:CAMPEP_0197292566 /NCGR_PEP_ID=MMETSP0890-20130614/24089_1 /TAXON_ID=44058 ORGANISM="Aureoumbra lagunensis, Strain CCMP1510" /NCGR_SAMPLE_ID=MMETSP0890 /ASSEMBLY_ACC=CAM_ASM_000533 /LENGTH=592 /DNA_ID=CAMNT_0042766595 /DNA_START=35 /DNA_END=1813 /DNA_ORIENTATION=-
MDKTAAQRAQLRGRLAYFKDNIQTQEDTEGSFDASRYYYNRTDEPLRGGTPGGGNEISGFQNGYAFQQQTRGVGTPMGTFSTGIPPPPPGPPSSGGGPSNPFFPSNNSLQQHHPPHIGGPRSPPTSGSIGGIHNTHHQLSHHQQHVFGGPTPGSSTTNELLSMLNKGLTTKPPGALGNDQFDLGALDLNRRIDMSEFPALGPNSNSVQQHAFQSDTDYRQNSAFQSESDFPALPTPAAGGGQQVQRSRLGELRSGSDAPSLLSSLQRDGSSLIDINAHAMLSGDSPIASGPLPAAAAPGRPGSQQIQSGMMLGTTSRGQATSSSLQTRFLSSPHAENDSEKQQQHNYRTNENNTVNQQQNDADKNSNSTATTQAQRTKYGLMGLLDVIRMTNADLNTLALGSDLTTLGLNLNSSECLYSTFASPWSQEPTRREPQFSLPACYYMQPPPLKTSHLAKFQLETLFYVFYAMPKDVLQAYAAQELYNREWQYHQDLKLWFKRGTDQKQGGQDNANSDNKNGQYIYFDIQSWDCRLFSDSPSAGPLTTQQQQSIGVSSSTGTPLGSSSAASAQRHSGLSSGLLPENDVRIKFNAPS